jgi:hypothetical protein
MWAHAPRADVGPDATTALSRTRASRAASASGSHAAILVRVMPDRSRDYCHIRTSERTKLTILIHYQTLGVGSSRQHP